MKDATAKLVHVHNGALEQDRWTKGLQRYLENKKRLEVLASRLTLWDGNLNSSLFTYDSRCTRESKYDSSSTDTVLSLNAFPFPLI